MRHPVYVIDSNDAQESTTAKGKFFLNSVVFRGT